MLKQGSTLLLSRVDPGLTKVLIWRNKEVCGATAKYELCWPLGRAFKPVMIPGLDPNVFLVGTWQMWNATSNSITSCAVLPVLQ